MISLRFSVVSAFYRYTQSKHVMLREDISMPAKAKSKEMGPIMFLSLFLLLLAFFILLNTLSTFEEAKARQVIKSVTSTFKTELINKTKAQIFISTLGAVPDAKDIINNLENLWVTAVPIANVEELHDGSTMQLTMPVNDLFVGGEIALRSDREDLMKATASALSAQIPDSTIEMQFMMGIDSLVRLKTTMPVQKEEVEIPAVDQNPEEINLNVPDEDNRSLAFARVGNVAQKFIDAGVASSNISIGLRHADPKVIRIRFFVRPNSGAFNSFDEFATVENENATLVPDTADLQNGTDAPIENAADTLNAEEGVGQ